MARTCSPPSAFGKTRATGIAQRALACKGSLQPPWAAAAAACAQVVAPLPGGPVDQAGVRSGDVITAVDGKPTRGISLYEASDLLQVRGRRGGA